MDKTTKTNPPSPPRNDQDKPSFLPAPCTKRPGPGPISHENGLDNPPPPPRQNLADDRLSPGRPLSTLDNFPPEQPISLQWKNSLQIPTPQNPIGQNMHGKTSMTKSPLFKNILSFKRIGGKAPASTTLDMCMRLPINKNVSFCKVELVCHFSAWTPFSLYVWAFFSLDCLFLYAGGLFISMGAFFELAPPPKKKCLQVPVLYRWYFRVWSLSTCMRQLFSE